jgi:hypothetical protein
MGHSYLCYKSAGKAYRHSCRNAVQSNSSNIWRLISTLHKQRKSRKMWNVIRRTNQTISDNNAIKMKDLADYFKQKFKCPDSTNGGFRSIEEEVNVRYNNLLKNEAQRKNLVVSNHKINS